MSDLLEISRDLSLGNQVKLQFHLYEPGHEEVILTLLGQALSHFHLNYLENILATVINELVNNASKANLKRVFFKKMTKDIHDRHEYKILMQRFKEEAVIRLKSYYQEFMEEGLYIQVAMQMTPNGFRIEIINNVEMTDEEKSRVQQRLKNAANLNSMSEAFERFGNDEEGAGLGIVLNVQLLKNAGIEPSNFTIDSLNGQTISSIFIPSSMKKPENLEKIHRRILDEIIELPVFSESTKELLDAIESKNFTVDRILPYLEKEPGLSLELIREASLVSYRTKKFESLREACEFLGKNGLYQVISTCSTRKIMESRYSDFLKFWLISRRCAFYARELGFHLNRNVSPERLYLAGMFHNLGKMIIFSLQPDIVQSLSNTTMEEIQMGVSNSQVGSLVAEKWGYSKELVSLLKNYLRPMTSPEKLREEACILHIADYMIKSLDKRDNFVYLDVNALNQLGLQDKPSLAILHDILESKFIDTNSSLR